MQGIWYTLGVWRVKLNREQDFVAAWKELGAIFMSLPSPPGPGTLVQSVDDPQQFYSFGPWSSLEDIQAMRTSPQAQKGIAKLRSLCEVSVPGSFRVVATAP